MLFYHIIYTFTEHREDDSVKSSCTYPTLHTHTHTPVYCVVIIISSLSSDPAPQLTAGQSGPHAVRQQGDPAPVALSTSAPATRQQLVRAGVGATGGGTQEAVQEVTDSSGERCRFHILGMKIKHMLTLEETAGLQNIIYILILYFISLPVERS